MYFIFPLKSTVISLQIGIEHGSWSHFLITAHAALYISDTKYSPSPFYFSPST